LIIRHLHRRIVSVLRKPIYLESSFLDITKKTRSAIGNHQTSFALFVFYVKELLLQYSYLLHTLLVGYGDNVHSCAQAAHIQFLYANNFLSTLWQKRTSKYLNWIYPLHYCLYRVNKRLYPKTFKTLYICNAKWLIAVRFGGGRKVRAT